MMTPFRTSFIFLDPVNQGTGLLIGQCVNIVEHGPGFFGFHNEREKQVLESTFGGVGFRRTDEETPGHGILRNHGSRVIGVGRTRAEPGGVGIGHQTGVLPLFGNDRLDIGAFFRCDFVERRQDGEHQGHHQHEHHCSQCCQNRPDWVASDILEYEYEKFHGEFP